LSIGATFCAMPVRFRPVPNEIIIGKLRCCFARCSKIRNGSTHILLRVLAVNVTRSDDLGRVASMVLKIRNFDRRPIGVQHHGLVDRLREMGRRIPASSGSGSRCSTCAGDRPSGYRRVVSEAQYWLDELNAPQYATLLV
jgi:hypothetical protein